MNPVALQLNFGVSVTPEVYGISPSLPLSSPLLITLPAHFTTTFNGSGHHLHSHHAAREAAVAEEVPQAARHAS